MYQIENIIPNMPHEKSHTKEIRLASYETCTGCAACVGVCPTGAVLMEKDQLTGFQYPRIDTDICVSCGKCTTVCPALERRDVNHGYAKVYAANNKDIEERYKSASGAIFQALARGVIENGGVAAGVVYGEDDTCRHTIAENLTELVPMCGTKYFQSDMTGIYEKIYQYAKQGGREIFFCGTPCQVRGVKNFASERRIEEQLITVDLLCRGIPSPYIFKNYIALLEKHYGKKVKNVQFKEKTKGWNRLGTMITWEDGTKQYQKRSDSAFINSFLSTNLSLRESCFQCPYKKIDREGDITIADFWGLRNKSLVDNMGTSLVVLNTLKGERLFQKVEGRLDYIPSTMWRVYHGNTEAFHPVSCEKERRRYFYHLLREGVGLDEAVARAMQEQQI